METILDDLLESFQRFHDMLEHEPWDLASHHEACELIAKVNALKRMLALYVGQKVANVVVGMIYESVFRRV